MNELIFADLHFHEHSTYYETEDPRVFINIELNVLEQIEKYIWDSDAENVYFLGDLYDHKETPIWYVNKLQGIFYAWAEIRSLKNIFLLRGTPSHDGMGIGYVGNLFQYLPKMKIINRPMVFKSLLSRNVLMIPWCPKSEMIKELQTKAQILMMHDAVKGAKIADYQTNIKEFLDVKYFSKFDSVYSGHIHKYQKFKNICYVGSPYRISFAEKDDPKGFIHLTNKGPKFIELEVPGMIEIDFGCPWISNDVKGKFVKLNYKNVKKNLINTVVENMLKSGALGVKRNKIYIEEQKEKREVRLKEKDDPNSMIDKYLDMVELKDLDKTKIKRIGKTAIREGEKYGTLSQ